MRSTTDKRVIKTKKLIKETFLHLLSKREFDKISITLLAKEAHIDRKTFYAYYSNTKELLEEYGEDLLDRAICQLNRSEEFNIELLFTTFNEIIRENETLFQEVIRTRINEFLIELCELRIIELLHRKVFNNRNDLPLAVHYHIRFITSGLMSIYIEWIRANDGSTIGDLAKIAVEIVSVNFEQLEKFK